ncbi:DUF883 family protein [Bauldia litoralis]|uniref:Membrane-anchored ribosome-binding protein, inhibits growth in stationary phase, ElaB/YqjD/DUF883 family n=1 Tax=Bauldia litoralis TaxID=665467 RepID=A0A1G6A5F5_9HYPH|nr:DUF883 family protein [Bauldia litoralis]SDB03647.1 Membrane-anchored ribosome-binding protein, inhibits growth in stationary phase, ElaB/YqjD/DUF883 family [Bauldia litoralis]
MATTTDKEMSENLDKLRADIAALSATVKTLVSDTSGIQSTLKKKFDETTQQASSMGERIIKDATGMGNDALAAAAKQASSTIDEVEVKITKNPFASVLIALGVGFAVGLLNRR